MTLSKSKYIDLSVAPWTMHEFFAGSGLVGYGLQGMFAPIWANDISEQKAAVYTANFGAEHFFRRDSRLAQRSCVGMASHPRRDD